MRKRKLTSNEYDRILTTVKRFYPEDQWEGLDKDPYFLEYSVNVYLEIQEHLPEQLKALMMKHYPVFEKEQRVQVWEYLDNVNKTIPMFCLDIYNLLKDQQDGVDLKVKYPDLQSWRSFYDKPTPSGFVVDEAERLCFQDFNDQEWEAYKSQQVLEMQQFQNWSGKRQFEFIDHLQRFLINLCPRILDLESDAWVVYGMIVMDQYDKWKCCCEHIEIFIDYGFEVEMLALPHQEYDEMCYKRFIELMDSPVMKLRERRIAGERV